MARNRFEFVASMDSSGFKAGWNSMEHIAKTASARLQATLSKPRFSPIESSLAQIVSIAAITKLTKETIDWASSLRDVSDELGVGVEWLQKMTNGAKLAGSNITDLAKFVTTMNQSRQDALDNPTGKNAKAFERLGVTTADISGLNTQDFFQKIVDAFKDGATVQSVNDIIEVGGKSARNLIAAFSAQFASDTPILAEELIDEMDAIGDSMTDLKTSLMVGLAPAIVTVIGWVKSFIEKLQEIGAFIAGFLVEGIMLGGNDQNIGGEMAEEVAQANKDRDEAIAKGRQAEKVARKKREQSPPLFAREEIKLEDLKPGAKSGRGLSQTTDALSAVGNFLGSGQGLINSIAEQHKQIAEQHLGVARQQLKVSEKILEKQSVGGMDIEVPGA